MKNLLISHGGAPTAVINASLAGVIIELRKEGFDGKIFAARFGSKGLYNEDFIDLTNVTDKELDLLKKTSGTAIGSSRFPLGDKEYEQIVDNLVKNNIGYLLFTGGNGSMDGLGKIYKHAKARNVDVACVGIPKTIDNDIAVTDHAPGFPSAARYMAATIRDCWQDVRGLPIHCVIIEAMGRNAGWLTASSALAREETNDAPQLLYFPEVAFDEEEFLKDVKRCYDTYGGFIVVASEGIHDKNGTPICTSKESTSRSSYFGEVAVYLSELVTNKLGIKCRGEKPGIIARSCSYEQSPIDRKEAIMVGKAAAKAVLKEKNGVMVGIKRISNKPYRSKTFLVPIEEVMLTEAKMPLKYIAKNNHDITPEFVDWLKPLIGELPKGITFVNKK
ncbi:MAG: diphosphate--fructose-6-phosphate 1-phosphotransferase [Bacilli bacterium]